MGWIERVFGRRGKGAVRSGFMEGRAPIFTRYGDSLYKSDVVRQAISRITKEISKLQPRQIRRDSDGIMVTPRNDINRLFENSPNELMTISDFLERVAWILFLTNNAFIYPKYERVYNTTTGLYDKRYLAFYPLMPIRVEFSRDSAEDLFITLYFQNGDKAQLPYSDIIHIRNEYSVSDLMGGNELGQPNTDGIKETVQINHDLFSSVAMAAKYALTVTGILKMNTMIDEEKKKSERERFEEQIRLGKSGILITDIKGEFEQLKRDIKLVDKETLEFLDSKILRQYNVSAAILNGDFTAEQYQAFYEAALENIIIKLGQAFSKTILTQGERNHGNEIVFYPAKLMFASVNQKTAIADILGNRGALTNNMLLEMFGLPPYEGGDVRLQSLNYVNTEIAMQYQMLKRGVINDGKNNESFSD
ncbi:MAG: phage portal protein [Oscillospiraceae bacterium]|nr:phage portal protein [Oscillospiraceae bacterium]